MTNVNAEKTTMNQTQVMNHLKSLVTECSDFQALIDNSGAIKVDASTWAVPVMFGDEERYVELKLTAKKADYDLDEAVADYAMRLKERDEKAAERKAKNAAKASADKAKRAAKAAKEATAE